MRNVPIIGLLGREREDILGLFRRDLFPHELSREDAAHFEGDEGTGADLNDRKTINKI